MILIALPVAIPSGFVEFSRVHVLDETGLLIFQRLGFFDASFDFLELIATAMNAVSVFRLFARLFLGKRRTGFTHMADALPRERWILAAGVLFVVLGGLFPNLIVAQRSAEADTLARGTYPAMDNVLARARRTPGNSQSVIEASIPAPAALPKEYRNKD